MHFLSAVRDHGIGIPAGEQRTIFDRFVRGAESKVAAHPRHGHRPRHGSTDRPGARRRRLSVESELGAGQCVHHAQCSGRDSTDVSGRQPGFLRRDSVEARRFISHISGCRRRADHRHSSEGGPDERGLRRDRRHDRAGGVRLATAHDYALDAARRHAAGQGRVRGVSRELRRAGCRTPIIVLTARTHDAEKVMGLELGADDYITKPFNPRELRARIKAVLAAHGVEAPELFRFGDVEVDFGRGEVRRGGRPGGRERARVQADHGVRPESWPPAHARAAARHGLGHGHRHQRSRHRQPHRQPAPEAGAGSGRAAHSCINIRGMGYRFDA